MAVKYQPSIHVYTMPPAASTHGSMTWIPMMWQTGNFSFQCFHGQTVAPWCPWSPENHNAAEGHPRR